MLEELIDLVLVTDGDIHRRAGDNPAFHGRSVTALSSLMSDVRRGRSIAAGRDPVPARPRFQTFTLEVVLERSSVQMVKAASKTAPGASRRWSNSDMVTLMRFAMPRLRILAVVRFTPEPGPTGIYAEIERCQKDPAR